MISGLSEFFKAKPEPTRFEKAPAFEEPLKTINDIRYKQAELQSAAKSSGIASVDYKKHLALTKLVKRLDAVIKEFNETKPSDNSDADDLKLTRKLLDIVSTELRSEEKTYSESRNDYRKNLSNAVYYGTFGLVFAAGSAITTGTVGTLATLFYVAPNVSNSVHQATGLNDLSPKTLRLINELKDKLVTINENLTKKLKLDKEVMSEDEDFICPISQDIIKDHIICTLDTKAYERKEIERWFNEGHRTAPCSGVEIPKGKTSKDVLFKNANYASLLEKYHREHPISDAKKDEAEEKLSPAPS